MVVLRGYDDQGIRFAHFGGEIRVLDCLPRIVRGQGKLCDIDKIGRDAFTFAQFPSHQLRCVQAHTTDSGCT
jgi:hypothetical protein